MFPSAGPNRRMAWPATKSTWKKLFGTVTVSECAPGPNVPESSRKTSCSDAVEASKLAAGAV